MYAGTKETMDKTPALKERASEQEAFSFSAILLIAPWYWILYPPSLSGVSHGRWRGWMSAGNTSASDVTWMCLFVIRYMQWTQATFEDQGCRGLSLSFLWSCSPTVVFQTFFLLLQENNFAIVLRDWKPNLIISVQEAFKERPFVLAKRQRGTRLNVQTWKRRFHESVFLAQKRLPNPIKPSPGSHPKNGHRKNVRYTPSNLPVIWRCIFFLKTRKK